MGGRGKREFTVVKIGKVRMIKQIPLAEFIPSAALLQFICSFVLCMSMHRVYKRQIQSLLFLKFIWFILWPIIPTDTCWAACSPPLTRFSINISQMEEGITNFQFGKCFFFLYVLQLERDQVIVPRSGIYPLSRRLFLLKASVMNWLP